ncbi:ribonuclease P protein component [Methylorubrum zatmanii]|uniref:Ribonuclease P protein component n=1 Tax=Methylorubrum zatmanii TaxID=29429 RepID=A0ABW1WKJ0_9HYPH|nr:ribonuclease P protein component [Methylorubrum zatmanii]
MSTIRRLRRRPDFLAAAQGRRFHTERMSAQGRLRQSGEMRDGEAAEGLFLGFTITKRVGHATERNRIRRRLRSAVEAVAADAPCVGADIVLIARRPALDAPFESLVEDLRRALKAVTRPAAPRNSDSTFGAKSSNPQRGGSRSGRGAAARGTPTFSSPIKAPDGSTDG